MPSMEIDLGSSGGRWPQLQDLISRIKHLKMIKHYPYMLKVKSINETCSATLCVFQLLDLQW